MIQDYDFHPRDDEVRVFDVPAAGVLVADDDVFVSQLRYDGDVVLRHYAFREHWFKINVTTDLAGELIETAPTKGAPAYALTIDLATPMLRDGDAVYAVDLEVDVLVKANGRTYVVIDLDRFQRSIGRGLISAAEADGVRRGLDQLVELIEGERLLEFLGSVYPFGKADPPPAPTPARRSVPLVDVPRLQPGKRLTWK